MSMGSYYAEGEFFPDFMVTQEVEPVSASNREPILIQQQPKGNGQGLSPVDEKRIGCDAGLRITLLEPLFGGDDDAPLFLARCETLAESGRMQRACRMAFMAGQRAALQNIRHEANQQLHYLERVLAKPLDPEPEKPF